MRNQLTAVVIGCSIALVGVLSLLSRCWRLDERVLSEDEAFTWRVIEYPLPELLSRVAEDVHGPAHFVLLKAWTSMWGDSTVSLRLPSVVCGILCAVGMLFVVWEAMPTMQSGLGSALFAAALTASSPQQVEGSRNARMYAFGGLLAVICMWLLLRALRQPEAALKWWGALGVVAAIFCYTHHFALFTLAGQATFVVLEIVLLAQRRPRMALHIAGGSFLAVGVAFTIYSPWLATFVDQASNVMDGFWIPPLTGTRLATVFTTWSAGCEIPNMFVVAMWGVLIVAIALFAVWPWQVTRRSNRTANYESTSTFGTSDAHSSVQNVDEFNTTRFPCDSEVSRAGRFFLFQAAVPWCLCLFVTIVLHRSIVLERYLTFAQLALFGLWSVVFARLPGLLERASWATIMLAFSGFTLVSTGISLPERPQPGVSAMEYLRDQCREWELVLVQNPWDVNRTRYYGKKLGLKTTDIRCRQMVWAGKGPRGFRAALKGDDILWGSESIAGRFNRAWVVTELARGSGEHPAGMRLVSERRFEGKRDGTFIVSLYERDP